MTLRNQVITAFKKFLENDAYLIEINANERSMTHKLAEYLTVEFPNYDIDCEYNRIPEGREKRLMSFRRNIDSSDTDGATVYPDIIIHKRGTNDNFIVIEAKKKNSRDGHRPDNCKCDECKLRCYKEDLNYEHGFFVIFPSLQELEQNDQIELADYILEI